LRRIVASEFISADGYIVGPNEDMSWVMNNFNEEMGKYARELMSSMDTVLLGRVTYQIMVNAWPNMTEEQSPGADAMNRAVKVILSKTLKAAPWGKYEPAKVISSDVERRVRELKQQPGRTIVIYGSARVVQSLTRMGLVDEYQLLVHPVFLGDGKRLFEGMAGQTNLKLSRTQTFANGVNVLYYETKGEGAAGSRT
jgi:dihydrofolate reductase